MADIVIDVKAVKPVSDTLTTRVSNIERYLNNTKTSVNQLTNSWKTPASGSAVTGYIYSVVPHFEGLTGTIKNLNTILKENVVQGYTDTEDSNITMGENLESAYK